MRWWAAFFVAGFLAPPNAAVVLGVSLCAIVFAIGALAGSGRTGPRRGDGNDPVVRAHATAVCTITCATAIIVWNAAGAERERHDRTSVGSRIELADRNPDARVERYGFSRATDGGATGIRALALLGPRSWFLERLDDHRLSRGARSLVGALILDDRSGLDFTLSETYSYLGITHFLALSGMHLGAIAIPLSKALSRFIRSKGRADAVLLAALCLYSAVAGFPPSLLRSLFLCAVVIAYRFLGAHTDLAGSLIAGSFVLVVIDPSVAFDAGFQLSFAAVCGIAFIALPLSARLKPVMPRGVWGKIAEVVLAPALLTCSVQFLTLPLTIALFKRSPLLSPVVNVLVSIPFTILLYAGVLYVFLPLAPLRMALAPPVNLLCRFLTAAPGLFSRGPHAALLRGDFVLDVYVLGAVIVAWSLRESSKRRCRGLCAGLACIGVAFLLPAVGRHAGSSAAGTGASAAGAIERPVRFEGGVYVREGDGVIFLGERFSSSESYRVTRLLWGRGVRRIGCCVVTPSRLRRSHGLAYLLRRIAVEELVCSPYLAAAAPDVVRDAGERGIRIRTVSRGAVLAHAPWRVEILGPVYPPPAGTTVGRADADLSWRFVLG
ncbi:MAG TPA: ComEC/Rec2 family competence protein, partial [Candidatus Bathyarchaeia archaeon]|nr:ComEC/Rec2 family competence protein [Candidatus Bathyarchaeia archaeon]